MKNVVTAVFTDTHARTEPLWQYDYGQILQFSGIELPDAYEVHFSNTDRGTSVTQIGNANGVSIPDALLLSGKPVYAWVYLHEGENDGETEYSISIPVNKRSQPTDTTPTPVEQSEIDQAIAALQTAVAKCEGSVEKYPKIIENYWYVWDADENDFVNTGVDARGLKGDPGDKGNTGPYYTPAVSSYGVISWTNNGGLPNPEPVDLIASIDMNRYATKEELNTKLNASEKGEAGGVAELDAEGKVISSQLPSYVDDVVEYASVSQFPRRGESGKIYVSTSNNTTYRWTGSQYVPIGSSLALGETSSTAYRGDRGKVAYDHAMAKGIQAAVGLYKISTNAEGHVTTATTATASDIPGMSDKADKTDTVLNTTLSMGRKADTSVGTNSTALGSSVTASGNYSHAEGWGTTASNIYAHAEGNASTASGMASHAEGSGKATNAYAHAEGSGTTASGSYSHAEGMNTTAEGSYSHAEGYNSSTSGSVSHAEGYNTKATGYASHSEGYNAQALAYYSHAEGSYTKANEQNAHSEGYYTRAYGVNSHAEGKKDTNKDTYVIGSTTYHYGAYGQAAHSEGLNTIANGSSSHAEGEETKAINTNSHAEGSSTIASGTYSHSEGGGTTASGTGAHAEGAGTTASGQNAHAEGNGTTAYGDYSHAEGSSTHANGVKSHAEGGSTTASGIYSHAEGNAATASGGSSHAEGAGTTASGDYAHAEGAGTTASGVDSHSEGAGANASGSVSHAEGYSTIASGGVSHAEGSSTIASGGVSHAEGVYTIAAGSESHVSGMYNVADSYANWDEWVANTSYAVGDKVKITTTADNVTTVEGYICKTANSDSSFTASKWNTQYGKMNYAEIIGNGTSDNARSNARTLDWDGNERLMGDVYVGCNADSTGGTKLAKITDIPVVATTTETQAIINEWTVSA